MATAGEMRAQSKEIQAKFIAAAKHPLMPADAREGFGLLCIFIGEMATMAERLDALERKTDG